jgi:hypothetical protein
MEPTFRFTFSRSYMYLIFTNACVYVSLSSLMETAETTSVFTLRPENYGYLYADQL